MHEGQRRVRSRFTCPACAEALPPGARVCGSCGERRESWRPRRSLPERSSRSPGLAAALAAIFPGAGHLYCERIAAGLMVMFVFPAALSVVALLALLLGPLIGAATGSSAGTVAGVGGAYLLVVAVAFGGYVWQILDAYASARPAAPRFQRRRRPQPLRAARARSTQASGDSPGAAAPR